MRTCSFGLEFMARLVRNKVTVGVRGRVGVEAGIFYIAAI